MSKHARMVSKIRDCYVKNKRGISKIREMRRRSKRLPTYFVADTFIHHNRFRQSTIRVPIKRLLLHYIHCCKLHSDSNSNSNLRVDQVTILFNSRVVYYPMRMKPVNDKNFYFRR